MRFPRMTVYVDDEGEPRFDPGPVEVRTDIWPSWLTIAHQQCDLARVARASNPGHPDLGEQAFGDAINAEYRASMVSMCAAAFALEAFANSVHHHLPSTKLPGRSADARIHQTLCRAFKLTNVQSKETRSGFQQIFRFRDRAVHPPAAFVEAAGHPHFRVGLEPSYVIFRLENAETTYTFVHQVLWGSLRKPRGTAEFRAWCQGMADVIGEPPTNPSQS